MCFFCGSALAATPVDLDALYGEISEVLQESHGDPDKYKQAIELLSQGLAQDPDNLKFLNTRMNLLCALGRVQEAKEDLDKISILREPSVDMRFFQCLLNERLGEEKSVSLECYREVARAVFEGIRSGSKYHDLDDELVYFNFVILNLLAENPEAEALKVAYLALLRDQPYAEDHRKLLLNFNRAELLP